MGYLPYEARWHYRVTIDGVRDCKARIKGGWDRGQGDIGHFGARIDLALPRLDEELAAHAQMSDYDYTTDISDEAQHQDAIRGAIETRTPGRSADGARRARLHDLLERLGLSPPPGRPPPQRFRAFDTAK